MLSPYIFVSSSMTFLTWQKLQFLGGVAIQPGLAFRCTITLKLTCNVTIMVEIAFNCMAVQ